MPTSLCCGAKATPAIAADLPDEFILRKLYVLSPPSCASSAQGKNRKRSMQIFDFKIQNLDASQLPTATAIRQFVFNFW
jgi:hypothetical protein